MKGMNVEISGTKMIIVDRKGNFKKVKYIEGCRIGEEIDISVIPSIGYTLLAQRFAAIAAVFMIMFGIGLYSYYSPYSYVAVDINPSVEIVLNRFERVLDVKALNEDAHIIVNDSGKYMHNRLDKVIKQIIDNAYEKNYIKADTENEILITVSAPNPSVAEQIGESAKKQAEEEIKQDTISANIIVEGADIKKYKQAQKENISVGKLILFEKLKEVLPEATVETVKNKSVKEILNDIDGKHNSTLKQTKTDGSNKENKEKTDGKRRSADMNSQKSQSIFGANKNNNINSGKKSEKVEKDKKNEDINIRKDPKEEMNNKKQQPEEKLRIDSKKESMLDIMKEKAEQQKEESINIVYEIYTPQSKDHNDNPKEKEKELNKKKDQEKEQDERKEQDIQHEKTEKRSEEKGKIYHEVYKPQVESYNENSNGENNQQVHERKEQKQEESQKKRNDNNKSDKHENIKKNSK